MDEEKLGKKVKRIEDRTQYRKAHAGDLVFNMMRAWQGAIGTAPSDGLVSPAYIVAKPSDAVHPPFMDYYMKTPRMIHTINRQSYGVTDFRKRLYWDSFAPITCVLPSLPEQCKIAVILTTQDKVIELKEKLLAEKQRQKKYLMQQLLTGKKRLAGFTGKWITQKSVFQFQKGEQLNVSSLNPAYHYPMYNGGTSYSGYANQANCENSIIISEGGNSCGFVNFITGAFWAGGHCYYITRSKTRYAYLYHLLKHNEARIMSLRVGSGLPNIQKSALESLELTYPVDTLEQETIVTILNTADHEISLLQESITAEKAKKKALMQLLLTGIVKVNVNTQE